MAPRGRTSQRGVDAADLDWRWRTASSSRGKGREKRPVDGSRILGGSHTGGHRDGDHIEGWGPVVEMEERGEERSGKVMHNNTGTSLENPALP
jgi:hypothetical protein